MTAVILVYALIVLLITFLSLAEKKKKFVSISPIKKQVIIGCLFAFVSIFATLTDSDLGDVPALCAGLLFGPIAGIVTGILSAIHITIVALVSDLFTLHISNAFSVVAAGIFAGIFRKYLLENQHPPIIYGILLVLISKLSFLFILLFTNLSDLIFAFNQASDGVISTLLVNSIGVIIGILVARAFYLEDYKKSIKMKTISRSFQFALLVCIIIAFISTFYFTATTQKQIAEKQAEDLIMLNLQDAMDYSNRTGQSLDELISYISTWRIGKEGGIIALDNDYNVVSNQKFDIAKDKLDFANNKNKFMINEINDESFYCITQEYQGYYFIGYISVDEALYFNDVSLYATAFVETLIFVMIYIVAIVLSKMLIVKNINKINQDLQNISNGDLEVSVNVRTFKEFDDLSNYINVTVSTLKEYIHIAKEQIDKELLFAKEIQHAAIPSIFPPYPNRHDFDIYGSMFTAKEVGGDFYDFCLVDEDKLAFIIADVSGKGVPAAMFMMVAKTMIKSFAESGKAVNDILKFTNRKLCENNDVGMFVTAWMGIIDLNSGVLTYANAGHNPPLICRQGERFEYLRSKPNLVLAAMEDVDYQLHETTLSKGDTLFLYTDGITEAINEKEELYNEVRLYEVLNQAKLQSMQEYCEIVKKNLDDFIGDEPQFDDITMLAFQYKGAKKSMKELLVNATVENISKVIEYVDEELELFNCPMKAQMQIDIAIDELFGNIAKYAYNPDVGPATVRVEVMEEPMCVVITFIDNGMPYDPLQSVDPDIHLPAEEREIGGLGIYIVKKSMDEISYEYKRGQNILTIRKKI